MQRIIGASVLLLLAGVTAYIVHRYNRRSSPVAQQIKRPHSTSERNYVDVKPKYLVAFFKSHTAIQAEQMVAVYLGSWMRLSGSVGTVMNNGPSRWQLTFRFSPLRFLFSEPTVFMYFVGEKWAARLATLRREEKVIVDGRIRGVDVLGVHLENCEFVAERVHLKERVSIAANITLGNQLKQSETEEHIPIPANITLDELRNFYKDRTQIEADKLISPYINKWITVEGKVAEISRFYSYDNICSVFWHSEEGLSTHTELKFGQQWKSRIELLRKGDIITVDGKIRNVDGANVVLDDCALINKLSA